LLGEKIRKQLNNALEALRVELSEEESVTRAKLLFVLDDVSPHVPESLLYANQLQDDFLRTAFELAPRKYVFTKEFAKWFFASTRWKPAKTIGSNISVEVLRRVMPPRVVASKARYVGVWDPILRAFDRSVGKTVLIEENIVTILVGGQQPVVTCFNLRDKLFACSCPAYSDTSRGENWLKRHLLCKHLLKTIYHHYKLLARSLSKEELEPWNASLSYIESRFPRVEDKTALITNWLYYFTRKVFSKLNFRSAFFKNPQLTQRAVRKLLGGGEDAVAPT